MGPDRNRGEIAEAIDVGVTGHERESTPGEVSRVEDERGSDGGVLREDAEEVRVARLWEVLLAERD